jgi:hypothetical protein
MKTKEIKLILEKEVELPDEYEAVADWRLPGDGELFIGVDQEKIITTGPLDVCRPVIRKKPEPWKCTGLWAGTGCWLSEDDNGFKLSAKQPEFFEPSQQWDVKTAEQYMIIDDTDGLLLFTGPLPLDWENLPHSERIVQL